MRGTLYALVGAPSVLGGALLLLSRPLSHHVAFATALLAGGATLLWLGVSGRRLGRVGWVATGALTVAGLLASLLVVREEIGCMFCYQHGQGYPWNWLKLSLEHDDMPTVARAREIAAAEPELAHRYVNRTALVLDTVFWAYVALVPVTVATLLFRRARAVRRRRSRVA